jgi:hypothetical protein
MQLLHYEVQGLRIQFQWARNLVEFKAFFYGTAIAVSGRKNNEWRCKHEGYKDYHRACSLRYSSLNPHGGRC